MHVISDWGLWLAVAVILSGVGKFLDEYHIRHETKSRARDALVRWFFFVEAISIPDFGRRLALRMRKAGLRLGWRGVIGFLILGFLFMLFFLSVSLRGIPFRNPIGNLFAVAFDYSSAPLAALLAAVPGWFLLRLISSTTRDVVALLAALFSPVAIVATMLVGIVLFAAATGQMGFMDIAGIGFFGVLLTIPFFFLSGVLFMLVVSRAIIQTLRFLALRVFDAASDPQRSPFAYAAALLSALILVGKSCLEIAKHT